MEQRLSTTTLVEVSHYYYEDGLSQQEIADKLDVSRSLIALYIKKAREQGIVRIQIVDPTDNVAHLAKQIKEKFNLKHVTVVPSAHKSGLLTRRSLGSAVAQYLDQHLRDGDVLGLGWGRTIMEMVNLLAPIQPRRIDVVPLLGESAQIYQYTQLNQMVLDTARRFNGVPYFLLTPILIGSHQLRDDLLHDPSTNHVVEYWNKLSIACIGIGAIPPTEGQVVYIGLENIPWLIKQNTIGEICGRYFNNNGVFLQAEFYDRLMSASLEQLRDAGQLVAVAGGAEKTIATLGALRTRLISVLFVDETLAQTLLKGMILPSN